MRYKVLANFADEPFRRGDDNSPGLGHRAEHRPHDTHQ